MEEQVQGKKRRAVILSGGTVADQEALRILNEPYAVLVGVDRGLEWLYEKGICPTHIVGDFDSISEEILLHFRKCMDIPIREFNPVKDASDTEIALRLCLELACEEVILLGATGTRLDHIWANVQTLSIAKKAGIPAWIVDAHNRIRLIDGETHLTKQEAFGMYFSLFSLSGPIPGLTITGAKYPLQNHTLYPYDSLCVSNQIAEEETVISFPEGLMVLMETRD